MIIIDNKRFFAYDESYYVSEYGDVFSLFTNKILNHYIDIDGYHRVDIYGKHVKVHRMVYIVYVGPIPENGQINHKDDNKNNNHYSNLYCGSQKENVRDSILNGTHIGNTHTLIIKERSTGKILSFTPASNFIEYSNHPCASGSINKILSRNWFNDEYELIDFKKS